MPTIASLLDASGAGGSATIVEHQGPGTPTPNYIVEAIKGYLQQRGVDPAIINGIDAFVAAQPVPTTTLLSTSTVDGLNLHASLVSDTQAGVILAADLPNPGTGRAYNTNLQILLDRDTVAKLNNFTWFLLTLLP